MKDRTIEKIKTFVELLIKKGEIDDSPGVIRFADGINEVFKS